MGPIRTQPLTLPSTMPFTPIPDILADLAAGRPIILVDDPDRENEGDLCFAAEFATPELVNFLAKRRAGAHLPRAGRRDL